MGRFFHTEVRWTGPVPSAGECAALTRLLHRIDPDTEGGTGAGAFPPGLTLARCGASGLWRNPALDLGELLAVLHAYGFPCRGRQRLWDWQDELEVDALEALRQAPWVASVPDLGWLVQGYRALRLQRLLRASSRRFGRYLPPQPVIPVRHRSSGRGRSRRGRALWG